MTDTSSNLKKGVLLVNLGTPDSPSVADVRKYLREFLMDGRVIDIPALPRFFLVNGIIAPFRSFKSAKIYKEVWTEAGSPLKVYGYKVKDMLQEQLGDNYIVELAMRYQEPSIKKALQSLKEQMLEEIIVVPMFPQYASATTGSVMDKVMEIVKKWQLIPNIKFIDSFYDHPTYIETWRQIGQKYLDAEAFDHIIFTYHGLPESQIKKGDDKGVCLKENYSCCNSLDADNRLCYRAQCAATTRLMAAAMNIPESKYTLCFQSRLGFDSWLKPYTEPVIKDLVKTGHKKILAFSPSFVSDCLETTVEVGREYKRFLKKKAAKGGNL